MTREEIIKGLSQCFNCDDCDGDGAPWDCMKRENLISAAVELLKPVKPQEHDYVIYGCRYTCGACHHKIWRNNNFCPNCGRKVKWE